MLNMNEFNEYINTLLADLMDGYCGEVNLSSDDCYDAMSELVGGSEYFIYYGKAFSLVAMLHECDPRQLQDADEALQCDVSPASIYEYMQLLAHEALYQGLSSALQKRLDQMAEEV